MLNTSQGYDSGNLATPETSSSIKVVNANKSGEVSVEAPPRSMLKREQKKKNNKKKRAIAAKRGAASIAIRTAQIGLWLMKDMCWLLLLPALSAPLGVVAILLQMAIIWQARRAAAEVLHEFCVGLWLLGNYIWMIAESLYDDVDADINLGGVPLLGENHSQYARLIRITRVLFLSSIGILTLEMMYVTLLSAASPSRLHQNCGTAPRIVPVTLPGGSKGFIVSSPQNRNCEYGLSRVLVLLWILKDMCWLSVNGGVALLVAGLTVMIGGHLVLMRGQIRAEQTLAIVVELWLIAMVAWMVGELYFDDKGRRISAAVFGVGLCAFVFHVFELMRGGSSRKAACSSCTTAKQGREGQKGETRVVVDDKIILTA